MVLTANAPTRRSLSPRSNHDYGESNLKAPAKCPAADPDCYYSPLHQVRVCVKGIPMSQQALA